MEEALEFLRAAGISGAAKYAAGTVYGCVDEAQKIPPALEREAEAVLLKVSEAWTKLVSLPPGAPPLPLPTSGICSVFYPPISPCNPNPKMLIVLLPCAVNKLLDTAQPSVEFTRRKYVEAHGAIVASAAYTRTLETAAQVLHKVGCFPVTCSSPPVQQHLPGLLVLTASAGHCTWPCFSTADTDLHTALCQCSCL